VADSSRGGPPSAWEVVEARRDAGVDATVAPAADERLGADAGAPVGLRPAAPGPLLLGGSTQGPSLTDRAPEVAGSLDAPPGRELDPGAEAGVEDVEAGLEGRVVGVGA
jgi:hypothetical protein